MNGFSKAFDLFVKPTIIHKHGIKRFIADLVHPGPEDSFTLTLKQSKHIDGFERVIKVKGKYVEAKPHAGYKSSKNVNTEKVVTFITKQAFDYHELTIAYAEAFQELGIKHRHGCFKKPSEYVNFAKTITNVLKDFGEVTLIFDNRGYVIKETDTFFYARAWKEPRNNKPVPPEKKVVKKAYVPQYLELSREELCEQLYRAKIDLRTVINRLKKHESVEDIKTCLK